MTKPNTTCSQCGAQIHKRRRDLLASKSGKVFCNRECYGNSKKKTRECPVCGGMFGVVKNSITCSRACSNRRRAGIKYLTGQIKSKAEETRRARKMLIESRGPRCETCGFDFVPILLVHHVLQPRFGGTNDLENLKLLCPNCHALWHHEHGK